MRTPFAIDLTLPRIRFGRGERARLGEELARLGLERALLISTPGQADRARAAASADNGRIAAAHPHAAMHTPVDVTEAAVRSVVANRCDGIVAVGGGSSVNLAKAITARTGLPAIVLPTTYAGSEMTPILGETAGGEKRTRRDSSLVPRAVIYDADLIDSLPASVVGPSGMNAVAHAVEALYAPDGHPVATSWATEAIRTLGRTLPAAMTGDRAAREEALYGAWLASLCLAAVSMGLHHKLCHTLGGTFGLQHAETHAVMLPYSLAYNAAAAPEAARAVAVALDADDGPRGLHRLLTQVSPVTSLAALGLAEDSLDTAAERAVASPYPNPRPLDRAAIRAILAQAWRGASPETP